MPTQKLTPEIIAAAVEGYEAQKARINQKIAELKALLAGDTPEAATPEAPKPKRRLSAAGRRRIIEATKKRWAAVRAAKAQQEKAATKKTARKTPVKKAAAAGAVAQAAK